MSALLTLAGLGPAGAAGPPQAEVTLGTTKPRYVVGEPVVLNVTLTNKSRRAMRICQPVVAEGGLCPEILTYIRSRSARFEEFVPGPCEIPKVQRREYTLCYGASRRYQLRVLYGDGRLAFSRHGSYQLKVRFPVLVAQAGFRGAIDHQRSFVVDSNVTEVHVVEPQGGDLRVWQAIRSPKFLYFMQWGFLRDDDKQVVLQVARVLKRTPSSSYHDDLCWALAKYYYGRRYERDKLTDAEVGFLREALGMRGSAEFSYLVTDRRLDYRYVEPDYIGRLIPPRDWATGESVRSLNAVLAEVGRWTGVPLRCDLGPEASRTEVSLPRPEEARSLRQFMQSLADPGRTAWFREGDGYVLRRIGKGQDAQRARPPGESRRRTEGEDRSRASAGSRRVAPVRDTGGSH